MKNIFEPNVVMAPPPHRERQHLRTDAHIRNRFSKTEPASGINNDVTAVVDPLSPKSNNEQ